MPDEAWSIKRAFNWTRDYLKEQGDDQARLSTEWLLSHACGLSRIEVYTQFDKPLSSDERNHLREAVRRRAAGEPLQYITGEVGFRHLTLAVRPGVLIPRPETEVLVDLALQALSSAREGHELWLLDLCTGSGCVGLALADERPDLRVTATDICPQAVALANENATTCNLDNRFTAIRADLFSSFDKDQELPKHCYDLIVANPPYIPSGVAGMDALPKEVADFEPHLALDGGIDGLDFARHIFEQAPNYLQQPEQQSERMSGKNTRQGTGGIIMELDVRNVHLATDFAVQLNRYKKIDVRSDLSGRERFVMAMLD